MRTWILVATLLASGCSSKEAPKENAFGQSKADIATVIAKKYAFEAYPQWAAAHPERACPDTLAALVEYMHDPGPDPWGHPYRMFCGPNLPKGARGLAIASDGEDGKPDTADDLRTW